jgi:ribonucleoside-triphosphate reductase
VRVENTFSEPFDDWYNNLNQSEKTRSLLDIEGISRRCLDVGDMSHAYFTKRFTDVTIDSNANSGEEISPNNYGAEIVKGIQKLEGFYLLHRYATKRFGEDKAANLLNSIVKGDIYFHDSSGVGIQEVYCTSVSTMPIMTEGRPYGPLHSLPPKRADSFMAQCIEFCMDLSQQFAGAVALADLFINYAWYAKNEGLSDSVIINDCQKFVHVTNNTFRVGSQSPFSNLSIFDMPNLKKVFEHHVYPDGTHVDFEYVMHIQKLFAEWFAKGDPSSGLPYRFPVVTMNIYCDENKNIVDKEFLDFVAKVNTEKGCFNIYVNSGEKIASCCRLVNDRERMQFKVDTFGNGGMNLGSHRVVTINLPRIAIRANGDKEKFTKLLQERLEDVRDLLLIHRENIVKKRIESGFLKFFNPLKWLNLNRYFSTIGIIGIHEMNYFMGFDIRSEEGTKFTVDTLNYIEDFAKKTSVENKYSYNVEEIPGESVASKLCQKDKVVFGDDAVPFELYSNQYIPLTEDVPLPERIITTGKFMEILSGGGILHLNVKERITDFEVMKKLILYSVKNGVSHLAVNYGFGTCADGHTSVCGNSNICPICSKPIVDFVTRVIGYFSHVSNWGKTRREYEFPRRIFNGEEV